MNNCEDHFHLYSRVLVTHFCVHFLNRKDFRVDGILEKVSSEEQKEEVPDVRYICLLQCLRSLSTRH